MTNSALTNLITKLNNHSLKLSSGTYHNVEGIVLPNEYKHSNNEDYIKMFTAIIYNFYYEISFLKLKEIDYHYSLDFILAFINSKLFKWYNKNVVKINFTPNEEFISSFPNNIPVLDISKDIPVLSRLYNKIDDYSKKLLNLYFDPNTDEAERNKKVKVIETQINNLLYQLYDLTEKEIEIIEMDK